MSELKLGAPRAMLVGAALLGVLAAAPLAAAQGSTTGPNGAVTGTVPAGTPPGSTPVSTTIQPGANSGLTAPVLVSITLPQGATAPEVVSVSSQPANVALPAGVTGNKVAPGAPVITTTIQSPTGQPLANVPVEVRLNIPIGTPIFEVVTVNGQRVLQQVPASQIRVVNGQTIVTGTTNSQGQLDLVLGATLAAPVLTTQPTVPSLVTAPALTTGVAVTSPAAFPRTGAGEQQRTADLQIVLAGMLITVGATSLAIKRGLRRAS